MQKVSIATSPAQIYTRGAETDTVDYVVSDSQGLTATSTRQVMTYTRRSNLWETRSIEIPSDSSVA